MKADTRRSRGFTLLEILVALAIVGLALGAAISGTGEQVNHTDHLRNKTLAHWVALNRLTEVQVSDSWPATGSSEGTVEMARREWRWTLEVNATPDDNVRRLMVTVAPLDGPQQTLARAAGYAGPRPPATP